MTVFANGLEVSAKKQACKIIAAFPDTCFTPPQTPATPPGVPIPYPNFGTDGDLTSGSAKVFIKDEEISLENSSKFKKVTGDEAGSAPKKGIITSNKGGAAYAKKWSMDVKVESKGVVRFSDMATTNHACDPGDDAPWLIVGKPNGSGYSDEDDCLVGSYDKIVEKCNKKGGEAHHIIPDEYIRTGVRDASVPADETFPPIGDACAICVGGQASGKAMSERQSDRGKKIAAKGKASGHNNARGHGYMHYFFDGSFGNDPRPVTDAVKIAKQALVNVAKFKGSLVNSACAEIGAECIDGQFKKAVNKKPSPPDCVGNIRKSKERFANALARLNQNGQVTSNLMPTLHSSLT